MVAMSMVQVEVQDLLILLLMIVANVDGFYWMAGHNCDEAMPAGCHNCNEAMPAGCRNCDEAMPAECHELTLFLCLVELCQSSRSAQIGHMLTVVPLGLNLLCKHPPV